MIGEKQCVHLNYHNLTISQEQLIEPRDFCLLTDRTTLK